MLAFSFGLDKLKVNEFMRNRPATYQQSLNSLNSPLSKHVTSVQNMFETNLHSKYIKKAISLNNDILEWKITVTESYTQQCLQNGEKKGKNYSDN